jgi:hypothetical protein
MSDDLTRLLRAVGCSIHAAKGGVRRDGAQNPAWATAIKARCLDGIRAGIEAALPSDVAVRFVETPWTPRDSGVGSFGMDDGAMRVLGRGGNELRTTIWARGEATRTLTVLGDVVDGSWNLACDVPWSASTMVATTALESRPTPIEAITLGDFVGALVVPIVGDVATPWRGAGFYYGVAGARPSWRGLDDGVDVPLHPTDLTDVRRVRCFVDLFTAQSYESLDVAIDAIKPVMRDWADIGRFYGAGIELMSLLGTPGVSPGFGGYVAANQKADNLVPTKLLLEGAGAVVSTWWGEPIDSMRLLDRRWVAIGANAPLHHHLVTHLSTARRPP